MAAAAATRPPEEKFAEADEIPSAPPPSEPPPTAPSVLMIACLRSVVFFGVVLFLSVLQRFGSSALGACSPFGKQEGPFVVVVVRERTAR